jgi:hypothetical protein
MASGHPAGTAATPHEMPMVHVMYNPGGMIVGQGSYAPDGRPLPPGTMGNAGRAARAGHP